MRCYECSTGQTSEVRDAVGICHHGSVAPARQSVLRNAINAFLSFKLKAERPPLRGFPSACVLPHARVVYRGIHENGLTGEALEPPAKFHHRI